MSGLGHSRRFDRVQLTSGLTPQADIIADRRHVQKCQQKTSVNNFGAHEDRRRDRDAKRFGGLQVDGEVEADGTLKR
jgi:hypothetical protein